MIIILTFEKSSGNIYDAGLVLKDSGETKTFNSISEAETWADENDDEVCTYTKFIDLSDA